MKEIELRKLTPEEKLYLTRLHSFVFSSKYDENGIREKIAKGEYKSDNTYGVIAKDGELIAGMEVIPYTMSFDGKKAPMYGIAGVASLPENRRKGYIRNLFVKVFEDVYEKGGVFSHLYPFSYDYYRKFGYEECGHVKKYMLPIPRARQFKNTGTVHEFIREKDFDVRQNLIDVYEAYCLRHNIMILRSEERWNEIFNIPFFGHDRLYYWRDKEGIVKAWLKIEYNKPQRTMFIHDIAWVDHESMIGILQFMGMFEGTSAEKMSFTASPEFVAELYWNDLYTIQTEPVLIGMNRIINAEQALFLLRKPEGEGAFVIKIVDDFAQWNNNTYLVSYRDGECNVSKTTRSADIETSECGLMQMLLGVYNLKQVAYREDVQINGNEKTLEKVFYKKNLLLIDRF